MDQPDRMEELKQIIEEFQKETGLSRREFVIVANEDSPIVRTSKNGIMEVIAGIEVVINNNVHEMNVGLFAREHLDELDDIIFAMGFDEPLGETHIIENEDGEVEIIEIIDDEDIIEAVECYHCQHPISVLNSPDEISVLCPWCNRMNEIE